jgi:hypothetical protein
MFDGVVKDSYKKPMGDKQRLQTFVVAEYDTEDGGKKEVKLLLRNVVRPSADSAADVSAQPGVLDLTQSVGDFTLQGHSTQGTGTAITVASFNNTIELYQDNSTVTDAGVAHSPVQTRVQPFGSLLVTQDAVEQTSAVGRDGLVCESHGKEWYIDNDMARFDINGLCADHSWSLTTTHGDVWTKGYNKDGALLPFDVFMQLFPAQQLLEMVTNSNIVLRQKKKNK